MRTNNQTQLNRNGLMHINGEGIHLIDDKQASIHFYKLNDVSEIRVISPWELTITRFMIGEADISFNVLSRQLSRAIPILDIVFRSKMDYINNPTRYTSICRSPQTGCNVLQSVKFGKLSLVLRQLYF